MKIKDMLSGKRILIWGYGREGKATENFLKTHVDTAKLDIYEGDHSGIKENEYDYIIKSPGIVYFTDDKRYTSLTILFLNEFRDRTIGITGTKGKSTTSALMYEALKASGKKAILLGNIGRPCIDYYDEIDDDTYIVFELSCHQLSKLEEAPKYSVFLNLYEEHLDYYGTLEKYFKAKANITTHQKAGDHLLVGENVPHIETKASVTVVKKPRQEYDLLLAGRHNKLNAEFVYTMAVDVLGLPGDKVIEGMCSFKGLDHRLQLVAEKNGIRFYDDSISTIPEAAIRAAEAVKNTGTMLIGGMDRGIDYDILEDFMKERQDIRFILMYATGERISREAGTLKNVIVTADLEEAFKTAVSVTACGEALILSPAAASYGYFKNFEERGDRFKEYVNAL